ncbi:MAG: glycosyltransferase family 1 protein [Bacteroidales bacterium]|nr:glycosyltransferase family 1 protein [Bacteroidales bacterium]MDY0053802.1 glycosyltransferase family 1 protein [Bacteroidales bacterium]
MRIAVNTRLLLANKLDGIGYFTYKLLENMCKNHPQDEFIFFFDRPFDKEFIFSENVIPVVIPCQTRHPLLWRLYFQYLIPKYLKKYKADLFFSPDGFIPKNINIPIINTIHDLNYVHQPQYIENPSHRRYLLKEFPVFARKSDLLITVSEFSKRDIIELYDIHHNKIEVVFNAANEAYYPLEEEEKTRYKNSLTQGRDYFYFVGSIHKRKNLGNLFKAFDLFKEETKSDVMLIIVGEKRDWEGELEGIFKKMKHKKDVILTGRLDAKEINKVSNSALALAFVSQFEGFGIPIVEAFAAGCPVITSNTTSMPEVAGDAAIYCDPFLVASIAEAMEKIYTQPSLINKLRDKGFEQNKKFSWEKSSERLWNSIEKTMNLV